MTTREHYRSGRIRLCRSFSAVIFPFCTYANSMPGILSTCQFALFVYMSSLGDSSVLFRGHTRKVHLRRKCKNKVSNMQYLCKCTNSVYKVDDEWTMGFWRKALAHIQLTPKWTVDDGFGLFLAPVRYVSVLDKKPLESSTSTYLASTFTIYLYKSIYTNNLAVDDGVIHSVHSSSTLGKVSHSIVHSSVHSCILPKIRG